MRRGNFSRRDLTKVAIDIIEKILLAEPSNRTVVKHGKRFERYSNPCFAQRVQHE